MITSVTQAANGTHDNQPHPGIQGQLSTIYYFESRENVDLLALNAMHAFAWIETRRKRPMIILRWRGWLCSLIVLTLALPVAALAQGSPNSKLVEAAKKEGVYSHPNAARLFNDFILSKEGQEMLRGMQRIPVRKDVEPDPPRLFRGLNT
jgi:hypothetical protein